jgi:HK97 family phage prohead protease
MKNFIRCYKELKDVDQKGTVVFYANTFYNEDTDGEVSLPGSFKKTVADMGPRLRHLKYHDTRLMPGVIKEITEDKEGLLVKSKLILDTQLGRETYEEYKAMHEGGKQMEHSVAVEAVKFKDEDSIRKVSEWKLWEVSTLTAWGANKQALSVSIKNMKDATREDIEKELLYLKALLNIRSYDDYKAEQIDKQISYLNTLKAVLQPEPSTVSNTFMRGFGSIK